jgi:hypothetical protein
MLPTTRPANAVNAIGRTTPPPFWSVAVATAMARPTLKTSTPTSGRAR